MTSFTIIISEAPYGMERAYSGLRFALTAVLDGHQVRVFLLENGVYVAKSGQKPPASGSSLGGYLEEIIKENVEVKMCTPCAESRGLNINDLVKGVSLASMHDLVDWTASSDKVIVF